MWTINRRARREIRRQRPAGERGERRKPFSRNIIRLGVREALALPFRAQSVLIPRPSQPRSPCDVSPTRLHPDRTAGGHRDHRRPDRPAAARRPGGPRGGPADPVRQQPQAARPGRRTTTRATVGALPPTLVITGHAAAWSPGPTASGPTRASSPSPSRGRSSTRSTSTSTCTRPRPEPDGHRASSSTCSSARARSGPSSPTTSAAG